MTTRAERLHRAEALARDQLERQRDRLNKVKAQQREEERKTLAKRRQLVGQMVLDTPLASLDDQTLQGLLQVLAGLAQVPDPVAVLAGFLSDADGTPGTSVDGCALPAEGVSTAC
jgi:hypothetical protein